MQVRFLMPLLLLAALSGCEISTDVDLPGFYTLRGVGDIPLPISIDLSATRTIEIVEGSLQLRGGSGFVMSGTSRIIDDGAAPRDTFQTVIGTYELDGSTVRLRFPDGGWQLYAIRTPGALLQLISNNPYATTSVGVLHPYVYEPVLVER